MARETTHLAWKRPNAEGSIIHYVLTFEDADRAKATILELINDPAVLALAVNRYPAATGHEFN